MALIMRVKQPYLQVSDQDVTEYYLNILIIFHHGRGSCRRLTMGGVQSPATDGLAPPSSGRVCQAANLAAIRWKEISLAHRMAPEVVG